MEHKGLALLVTMIAAVVMANALPAAEPKWDDIAATKEVADDLETAASHNGGYGRPGDHSGWSKRYHYYQTTAKYDTTTSTSTAKPTDTTTSSTSTAKPTDTTKPTAKPPPCKNCHSCTTHHPIFAFICLDISIGRK